MKCRAWIPGRSEDPWKIVEYRGRAGLRQLEPDWRRLYLSMSTRTGLDSYEFISAYADHAMQDADNLRCLALTDGTGIRAICPLELRREKVFVVGPALRILASPQPLKAPWNIICPEDDARSEMVPAIARHLRRDRHGCHLVVLGPLEAGSRIWEGFRSFPPGTAAVAATEHVHVFDCTRSYDELNSRFTRKFRVNLRKARNKVERIPSRLYLSVRDPEELTAALDTFLEVEGSGWKGETGSRTALRMYPKTEALIRDLAVELHGAEDYCEVNSLYLEGRCIASQFCIRSGPTYSILRIGYDQSHAHLSPGHLLRDHTLRRCCDDAGIGRMHSLSGYGWHHEWRPDEVGLKAGYIALRRWSALPLIVLLRLRHGWGRRLVRRLRRVRRNPAGPREVRPTAA